jgi:hypothetical protein
MEFECEAKGPAAGGTFFYVNHYEFLPFAKRQRPVAHRFLQQAPCCIIFTSLTATDNKQSEINRQTEVDKNYQRNTKMDGARHENDH